MNLIPRSEVKLLTPEQRAELQSGSRAQAATALRLLQTSPDLRVPCADPMVQATQSLYQRAIQRCPQLTDSKIAFLGPSASVDANIHHEHIQQLSAHLVATHGDEAVAALIDRHLNGQAPMRADSVEDLFGILVSRILSGNEDKRIPSPPHVREELYQIFADRGVPLTVLHAGGISTLTAAIFGVLGGTSYIPLDATFPESLLKLLDHLPDNAIIAYGGSEAQCIKKAQSIGNPPPHGSFVSEGCLLPCDLHEGLLAKRFPKLTQKAHVDYLFTGNLATHGLDALERSRREEFCSIADAYYIVGLHKQRCCDIEKTFDHIDTVQAHGGYVHYPFTSFEQDRASELEHTLTAVQQRPYTMTLSMNTNEARTLLEKFSFILDSLEAALPPAQQSLAARYRDDAFAALGDALAHDDEGFRQYGTECGNWISAASRYLATVLQQAVRVRGKQVDFYSLSSAHAEGLEDAILEGMSLSRQFGAAWFARAKKLPDQKNQLSLFPPLFDAAKLDALKEAFAHLRICDGMYSLPRDAVNQEQLVYRSPNGMTSFGIIAPISENRRSGTVSAGDLMSLIETLVVSPAYRAKGSF